MVTVKYWQWSFNSLQHSLLEVSHAFTPSVASIQGVSLKCIKGAFFRFLKPSPLRNEKDELFLGEGVRCIIETPTKAFFSETEDVNDTLS